MIQNRFIGTIILRCIYLHEGGRNLIWVVYINPPKVQLLKHVSSVVWPKRFPPLVKLSFWWMNNLNTQFNHPSQLKMIVSSPLFIIPPVNKRKMNKPSRCTYINATQNLFALYLCDLDQVSTFIIFYSNCLLNNTKHMNNPFI